jgi:4-hydroxy-2-oxoheptanedioate aldolase
MTATSTVSVNSFKQRLARRGEAPAALGVWRGLTDGYSLEICVGTGFDWVLIDGEHAPNTVSSIAAQLQVMGGYPACHPMVRVATGKGHLGELLIKQTLDAGAQTLLVPMIDTAEQALDVVRFARYPTPGGEGGGTRGIAGSRGGRWGRWPAHVHEANAQTCIIVQAETRTALDNLDEIVRVEGVDGVFIGPSDLAGGMGRVGNPGHEEVQQAIAAALPRIHGAGKAAGIFAPLEAHARRYIEMGFDFVAVGADTGLLQSATAALLRKFRGEPATASGGGTGY